MEGEGEGLIGEIFCIDGNVVSVQKILGTISANSRSENRPYKSDGKNWEKLTDEQVNQAVAEHQSRTMNRTNAPVYYYPHVMPAHMHPLVYVSMRPYH